MALPSASAISQPRAWGYDARLGDLLLRLAVSPSEVLAMVGEPPDAERVQTAATAEEFVSRDGQTYGRADFSGGEGLFYAHRADAQPSDSSRYYKTLGCQVFDDGRRNFVTPQPSIVTIGEPLGNTGSVEYHSLVPMKNGSVMRFSENANVDQIEIIWNPTDPDTRLSTFETCSPGVSSGKLVVLGHYVFAAMFGEGVWKRSRDEYTTGWTRISTDYCTRLWAAKGRLIAYDFTDDALVTMDPDTGATATLLTVPDQQFFNPGIAGAFSHVVDAGPYVLVACWDGYIYGFQDESGTLTLVGQSNISASEAPYWVGYHPSGVLLVFTYENSADATGWGYSTNLYAGDVSTDPARLVDNLQLIRTFEPGYAGTSFGAPIAYQSNFYFVGQEKSLRNTPNGQWYSDGIVWRYDIATGGLHRVLYTDGAAQVGDVLWLDGRIIYNTNIATYMTDPTIVPISAAQIVFPFVDHYTATNKRWLDITLDGEGPDTSDCYFVVYVTDDPAVMDRTGSGRTYWTTVATVGRDQPLAVPNYALNEPITLDLEPSRGLSVMIEMVVDPNIAYTSEEDFPRLYSIQLRSQVTDNDFVIDLPVNVSDRIEAPNKEPFLSPGWGREISARLLGMKTEQVELEIYEPPLTATGWIQAVSLPVEHIPRLGSATRVQTVRFRGELTSTGGRTKVRPDGIVWSWTMPAPVVDVPNADIEPAAVFVDWYVPTPTVSS